MIKDSNPEVRYFQNNFQTFTISLILLKEIKSGIDYYLL